MVFQRLSAAGLLLGKAVPIASAKWVSPGQYTQVHQPRLVASAAGYGALWAESKPGDRQLLFADVAPDGKRTGPDVAVTTKAVLPDSSHLIWTGVDYAVTWVDRRDGNEEVYFTRLSKAGAKLIPEVRITQTASPSRSPKIAATSTGFGIAWSDDAAGGTAVYFARLDPAGALQGAPIVASTGVSNGTLPNLHSTGAEFGLFMTGEVAAPFNRALYFSRITASGAPQAALQVSDANAVQPLYAAGAFAGQAYGLVWSDARGGLGSHVHFGHVSCSIGPN